MTVETRTTNSLNYYTLMWGRYGSTWPPQLIGTWGNSQVTLQVGTMKTITSERRRLPQVAYSDPDWLRLHPNPCIITSQGASVSYDPNGGDSRWALPISWIGLGHPVTMVGQAYKGGTIIGLEGVPVYSVVSSYQHKAWDESLAGLSILKAYASMNEAEISGAVELSQARMTLDLLRKPLRTLIKLYGTSGLRRYTSALRACIGNDAGLGRAARTYLDAKHSGMSEAALKKLRKKLTQPGQDLALDASNAWLEYIYGWCPTVGLIQDIIKQFEDKLPERAILRSRKSVKTQSKVKYTATKTVSGFDLTFLIEETVTRRATTVLHYSHDKSWLDKYGFKPYDVANVVYENIPFSFVVNWFFSVEAWLNAYRSQVPVASSSTTCTVLVERRETLMDSKISGWPTPYFKPWWVPMSSVQYFRSMERRINQPIPSLPKLQSWFFNENRISTSVSLFWQRASKFFRKR